MSTSSGSKVKGSKGAAHKSYIRHSTSDYIPGSTASAATAEVGSCQSEWQIKEEQFKALQEKAAEAHEQPWL
jgi:O-acetylhomoserine/O-acetylserine sulfhydrylase-like pyridoxal-dependent enzyme